jgi:hypothetical protein
LTGRGLSLSGTYFAHRQPGYRHCPRFLRCRYFSKHHGQPGFRFPQYEQGAEIQSCSSPPCSQFLQIGISDRGATIRARREWPLYQTIDRPPFRRRHRCFRDTASRVTMPPSLLYAGHNATDRSRSAHRQTPGTLPALRRLQSQSQRDAAKETRNGSKLSVADSGFRPPPTPRRFPASKHSCDTVRSDNPP